MMSNHPPTWPLDREYAQYAREYDAEHGHDKCPHDSYRSVCMECAAMMRKPRKRRHPKFYMAGSLGEYSIRQRTDPYEETSALVVMELDNYIRARNITRLLNDTEGWAS